jgi:thiamine-monophosphate kinase
VTPACRRPLDPRPRRDETSWIRFLTDLWGPSGAEVGVGDDCAVLPPDRYALSTDVLAEGVDFHLGWAPPEALGHKALAANLSDLAACGASPRFLFLTLGIPRDLEDGWVERLARGMRDLAALEGLGLAGGDLSASASGLFLSLTVLGSQESAPLLRSGGRPGDLLFVGGPLGGARAGLGLLLGGRSLREFSEEPPGTGPEGVSEDGLMRRFFAPPSQTALGRFLASERLATCAMDISDGLAEDLRKLCSSSGCGAEVDLPTLPLEPGLLDFVPAGETARQCALRGGEDQVLLFAAAPTVACRMREAPCPVFPIGHFTSPEEGLTLLLPGGERAELEITGYDHFAP